MKDTKAHSEFSCSGSERWINCPGSIVLSRQAPPRVESEYAREGTDAHSCLEQFLKLVTNGKKPSASKVATLAHRLAESYPPEMVNHARDAFAHIVERASGCEIVAEQKVETSAFTAPGNFGTLDCAIVEHFGRLTIIDYKYGAGIPVDPDLNTQLILYALGMLEKHDYNFQDVALVIIQPRAEHEAGPIREWVTSVENLIEYGRDMKNAASVALKPNAPLAAGEWCRFCPAASICPEISKKAMRDAQIDFEHDMTEIDLPNADIFELRHLSHALRAADKIETWIAKLREVAFAKLNSGEKLDGFKLVAKRSIRRWVDEEKTASEALEQFGEKAFSIKILSPAQIEKIIDDKSWVSSRVSNVSSGLTLVGESDPRPAVNTCVSDFADTQTIKNVENLDGGKHGNKIKSRK